MENTNWIFLLDKDRGVYWAEVQNSLDNCSSQKEYNQLIELENRDLQIRELKHECYSLFQQMLTEHPALAENAPKEAFIDFLDEKRDELDQQGGNILVKDQRELEFLNVLSHDLRTHGPNSAYIKTILGGW